VPAYLQRLRAEPALSDQGFTVLEVTRAAPAAAAPGGAAGPAFVDFTLSSGDEAPKGK
jgi:hypothetical protein